MRQRPRGKTKQGRSSTVAWTESLRPSGRPPVFTARRWLGQLRWNGIVTWASTHIDPLWFPTLDPGRSSRDRGTRPGPRFRLLCFNSSQVVNLFEV
jgi:hypothetical protein